MYASEVNQQRLTFAVSGMLWQRSLVMIDSQTETLWSHILGRGMRGELEGTQLEVIPSSMTDWASWRRDYPETTVMVMRRTSRNYLTEFYEDRSRFVVGLVAAGQARAYPFDQLEEQPLVHEQVGDDPVLIVYQPDGCSALVFDRRVGDRTLTFRMQDEVLVDDQTQSVWQPGTGVAVDGELAGRSLTQLPGIASYRAAWEAFHPDSSYWSAEDH